MTKRVKETLEYYALGAISLQQAEEYVSKSFSEWPNEWHDYVTHYTNMYEDWCSVQKEEEVKVLSFATALGCYPEVCIDLLDGMPLQEVKQEYNLC